MEREIKANINNNANSNNNKGNNNDNYVINNSNNQNNYLKSGVFITVKKGKMGWFNKYNRERLLYICENEIMYFPMPNETNILRYQFINTMKENLTSVSGNIMHDTLKLRDYVTQFEKTFLKVEKPKQGIDIKSCEIKDISQDSKHPDFYKSFKHNVIIAGRTLNKENKTDSKWILDFLSKNNFKNFMNIFMNIKNPPKINLAPRTLINYQLNNNENAKQPIGQEMSKSEFNNNSLLTKQQELPNNQNYEKEIQNTGIKNASLSPNALGNGNVLNNNSVSLNNNNNLSLKLNDSKNNQANNSINIPNSQNNFESNNKNGSNNLPNNSSSANNNSVNNKSELAYNKKKGEDHLNIEPGEKILFQEIYFQNLLRVHNYMLVHLNCVFNDLQEKNILLSNNANSSDLDNMAIARENARNSIEKSLIIIRNFTMEIEWLIFEVYSLFKNFCIGMSKKLVNEFPAETNPQSTKVFPLIIPSYDKIKTAKFGAFFYYLSKINVHFTLTWDKVVCKNTEKFEKANNKGAEDLKKKSLEEFSTFFTGKWKHLRKEFKNRDMFIDLISYFNSKTVKLDKFPSVPMTCVVDYHGFRIYCESIVPKNEGNKLFKKNMSNNIENYFNNSNEKLKYENYFRTCEEFSYEFYDLDTKRKDQIFDNEINDNQEYSMQEKKDRDKDIQKPKFDIKNIENLFISKTRNLNNSYNLIFSIHKNNFANNLTNSTNQQEKDSIKLINDKFERITYSFFNDIQKKIDDCITLLKQNNAKESANYTSNLNHNNINYNDNSYFPENERFQNRPTERNKYIGNNSNINNTSMNMNNNNSSSHNKDKDTKDISKEKELDHAHYILDLNFLDDYFLQIIEKNNAYNNLDDSRAENDALDVSYENNSPNRNRFLNINSLNINNNNININANTNYKHSKNIRQTTTNLKYGNENNLNNVSRFNDMGNSRTYLNNEVENNNNNNSMNEGLFDSYPDNDYKSFKFLEEILDSKYNENKNSPFNYEYDNNNYGDYRQKPREQVQKLSSFNANYNSNNTKNFIFTQVFKAYAKFNKNFEFNCKKSFEYSGFVGGNKQERGEDLANLIQEDIYIYPMKYNFLLKNSLEEKSFEKKDKDNQNAKFKFSYHYFRPEYLFYFLKLNEEKIDSNKLLDEEKADKKNSSKNIFENFILFLKEILMHNNSEAKTKNLDEFKSYFNEKHIYYFTKSLDNLYHIPLDSEQLTEVFHSNGINMFCLGKVAELTSVPHVRELCVIEMIARICKRFIYQILSAKKINALNKLYSKDNSYGKSNINVGNNPSNSGNKKDSNINPNSLKEKENSTNELAQKANNPLFIEKVPTNTFFKLNGINIQEMESMIPNITSKIQTKNEVDPRSIKNLLSEPFVSENHNNIINHGLNSSNIIQGNNLNNNNNNLNNNDINTTNPKNNILTAYNSQEEMKDVVKLLNVLFNIGNLHNDLSYYSNNLSNINANNNNNSNLFNNGINSNNTNFNSTNSVGNNPGGNITINQISRDLVSNSANNLNNANNQSLNNNNNSNNNNSDKNTVAFNEVEILDEKFNHTKLWNKIIEEIKKKFFLDNEYIIEIIRNKYFSIVGLFQAIIYNCGLKFVGEARNICDDLYSYSNLTIELKELIFQPQPRLKGFKFRNFLSNKVFKTTQKNLFDESFFIDDFKNRIQVKNMLFRNFVERLQYNPSDYTELSLMFLEALNKIADKKYSVDIFESTLLNILKKYDKERNISNSISNNNIKSYGNYSHNITIYI